MVPRSSRRAALAIFICSVLVSGPAMADPAASSEDEAEAFDAGRTDEACDAFARSLKLYPKLSTLLNLALCQEAQGKTASAWRGFVEAGAWANDISQRERRDFANQHALKLERSLSRVEIRLPEGAAALVIDGEPVPADRLLWPVFLDPGAHAIEATAPGHVPYVASVTVPPSFNEAIVVTIPPLRPEAAPAPQPIAPAPPSSRLSARRVAGFAVGAIGILAVGLGGYLAGDALSKTTDLGTPCAGGCDPSAARASEIGSVMAFGVGIVGVGLGAWLVAGSRADPPRTSPVVVATRIGSQGGEVLLQGAW